MESEQRLIVCCNYKPHSNDEKGQSIALYEKVKDTGILYKINEEKYFSEPNDCEVHIIPNPNNGYNYSYLQERYSNRLYLIQCVENRSVDDSSNFSRNKSNLFKIESVEPKSVCEVIDSALPDESNPEIPVELLPLTRHIFVQDENNTYGPFEYNVNTIDGSNDYSLTLKKPGDTKYLNGVLPKLTTSKFLNSDLEEFIDEFIFSGKIVNGKEFRHKFISNLDRLKKVNRDAFNYGFMDEFSRAVWNIVKETNTKGITQNQIAILSARIKNKRSNFNFDVEYVLKQLNESLKFEKSILGAKSDLKDLMCEQLLNGNEKIREYLLDFLKNDDVLIHEVREKIRFQQQDENSKLVQIEAEVSSKIAELEEINQNIQHAREQKAHIDRDNEKRVVEELIQKQTQLNDAIKSLESKKSEIEIKYKDIFKFDSLRVNLDELEKDTQKKRAVYDAKVEEIREKKQEVQAQKQELKELTERSAEQYKKELLSVKNSIDVLTQIEDEAESISFECFDLSELLRLDAGSSLSSYIKYVQFSLSEHNRNMSIEHVINYLITIDNSFITILSGLPGTGKTSLVTLLGQYIFKSRFNNVQVGRGWSSERDLLGYFNPITNSFVSSGTGMYEFLDKISEDKRLNLVLLDEANLSPIEHYWSKFMGLADSFNSNELYITNKKSIKLSGNLRFIATINNDMTTEPLSPRLIDRAPCIRLDIYTIKDEGNKTGLDTIDDSEVEMLRKEFDSKSLVYEDIKRVIEGCCINDENYDAMLEFVEEIKNLLNASGKGDVKFGTPIHISERRNQAIKTYLRRSLCVYENFINDSSGWIDIEKHSYFLDFAIAQYILPLVAGHGKNFKNRMIVLKEVLENAEQRNYELPISIELVAKIISQGEEDLDTYDFMSLR